MPKLIQYALAAESFMNLLGAVPFLLYPEWCLSYVVDPSSDSINNPAVHPGSATLFQVYACLVIALTAPLLICIPESPGVAYKRVIMFQTLAVGEALLITLLLWKANDAKHSGYTQSGLILSAMSLTPYLLWRAYTLFVRPDWFRSDGGMERKRE